MDKVSINKDVLEKNNLSMDEFLVLLLTYNKANIQEVKQSLVEKGLADFSVFDDELVISSATKDLITSISIDSDVKVLSKDKEFRELADKLKELFPKGKKAGTTYMWRDSTAVIARKLKTLVVKYDYQFTEEQAIKATKAYVESFNGDYTYMQLLKYFILKSLPDGEIKSDFMSYIENEGQEDELSDNWLNEMR
ncbi:MAG: hypothetical protein UF228_07180 [Lachnospiraceae bacterium]|nr:hypothetical protein [Lachnospiraceae bacterium]